MTRINRCAAALVAAVSLLALSPSPAAAKRLVFNSLSSSNIYSIDLDGSNLQTLFSTGDDQSTSLAYDPVTTKIFWGVDIPSNYIVKANLDGSGRQTFPLDDGPDSMALDHGLGKLYYGSEDGSTLHWMNLDGTGLQTIVFDPTNYAFGIAIDATGGKVYWTLAGNKYIDRANLDGTQQEDLILGPGPDPAFTFGATYGIALDVPNGKMYFSDEDDSFYYRANLDGTGIERFTPEDMMHPHGIALDLDAGRIYWAQQGAIGSSDLDGGRVVHYPVDGFPHSLVIVPEPTTWALACGGLAALIVVRRRRR
jgi:sugar lactone lactonase YvrE